MVEGHDDQSTPTFIWSLFLDAHKIILPHPYPFLFLTTPLYPLQDCGRWWHRISVFIFILWTFQHNTSHHTRYISYVIVIPYISIHLTGYTFCFSTNFTGVPLPLRSLSDFVYSLVPYTDRPYLSWYSSFRDFNPTCNVQPNCCCIKFTRHLLRLYISSNSWSTNQSPTLTTINM